VGVEGGAERTVGGHHFARQPLDGLGDAIAIQGVARADMGGCEKVEELRVVVEHLLEVRYEPALVDGVTRKAAGEMIVDSALADALERDVDRLEQARVIAAKRAAPDELEDRGLRKLWCAAHSAVDRIDDAGDALREIVELGN